ncbi:hypothetical protein ACIREO_33530 [Streptomyces sp. NPDC102441]|uniref:hypothetical protein n=1 Tax=Streptomyces sp. NPDC102441 TaxID=3366176 RepID=UPI00382B48DE
MHDTIGGDLENKPADPRTHERRRIDGERAPEEKTRERLRERLRLTLIDETERKIGNLPPHRLVLEELDRDRPDQRVQGTGEQPSKRPRDRRLQDLHPVRLRTPTLGIRMDHRDQLSAQSGESLLKRFEYHRKRSRQSMTQPLQNQHHGQRGTRPRRGNLKKRRTTSEHSEHSDQREFEVHESELDNDLVLSFRDLHRTVALPGSYSPRLVRETTHMPDENIHRGVELPAHLRRKRGTNSGRSRLQITGQCFEIMRQLEIRLTTGITLVRVGTRRLRPHPDIEELPYIRWEIHWTSISLASSCVRFRNVIQSGYRRPLNVCALHGDRFEQTTDASHQRLKRIGHLSPLFTDLGNELVGERVTDALLPPAPLVRGDAGIVGVGQPCGLSGNLA